MKLMKDFFFFVIGFTFSGLAFYIIYFTVTISKNELRPRFDIQALKKLGESKSFIKYESNRNVYNDSIARSIIDKFKIVCLIATYPENHQTKAIHVKNTWGKKCNKLLFMSSKSNDTLEIVDLNITENRDTLWDKTKASYKYAYENHFNDGDWFLKADDDSYLIMENLREMLSQYNPNDSLYFGHRYTKGGYPDGYMAGGGYILSKRAVEIFVKDLLPTDCGFKEPWETGSEDFNAGICLLNHTIFVDCRDEKNEKRFFPVGMETHTWCCPDMGYWYFDTLYYNATQGSLGCCSDKGIQFHYVGARELYKLEYLIYRVHPFGIEDDPSLDILPRKLTIEEIISSSNSYSDRRRHMEMDMK